ncbi:transcriptional regulator [Variovorax sp. CY25R-8]|uniref:transcriptional regulator n=1 Tax=Variovorax sp. CY25R-8 TaxID=2855501 RepID=UPI003964849F
MRLSEYFATKRGAQAQLAKTLDVPAPLLSAWASENPETRRQVPAERCPLIERATNHVVRCEDLRPDVAWDVLRDHPAQVQGASAHA